MYMVQQRVTTAIREGFRSASPEDITRELAEARRAHAWLAALDIDPEVRAWLVEPIAAVEEALAEADRRGAQEPT